MKESKLQYLGRTLAERVLITTGEERRTLCSVLADVMWVMGQDVELPENDPVHWFDPKGRFCTRAQSREEIDDAMILMAIADNLSVDMICREYPDLTERVREWGAYQEMKCCYMEALMRIKELEEELKAERYRHDRYVDFELAQAEELRAAKKSLEGVSE